MTRLGRFGRAPSVHRACVVPHTPGCLSPVPLCIATACGRTHICGARVILQQLRELRGLYRRAASAHGTATVRFAAGEWLKMLEQMGLFSNLASEDLQFLADKGVTRTYPKNTILISEGDQSETFYVIRSGVVKVFASDENGKEVILNLQGPGEYFGELALIDDAPRSASVITMEKSVISVVSKADFHHCLADRPEIALQLIRPLVARIRSLTQSVKSLALLDVYGRVARTLLNLAEERQGKSVIVQRLTHQDIANMVGASREMVSRIMKDLATGGYIRIADRKIYIEGKLPAGW